MCFFGNFRYEYLKKKEKIQRFSLISDRWDPDEAQIRFKRLIFVSLKTNMNLVFWFFWSKNKLGVNLLKVVQLINSIYMVPETLNQKSKFIFVISDLKLVRYKC